MPHYKRVGTRATGYSKFLFLFSHEWFLFVVRMQFVEINVESNVIVCFPLKAHRKMHYIPCWMFLVWLCNNKKCTCEVQFSYSVTTRTALGQTHCYYFLGTDLWCQDLILPSSSDHSAGTPLPQLEFHQKGSVWSGILLPHSGWVWTEQASSMHLLCSISCLKQERGTN